MANIRTVNVSEATQTRINNYLRPDSANVQADTHEFLTKAFKDLHRKVESRLVSRLYENPQKRELGDPSTANRGLQIHPVIFEGITARAVEGKSHDDVINDAIDAYELRIRKAPFIIGAAALLGVGLSMGVLYGGNANQRPKLPPVPRSTTTTTAPAPTTTTAPPSTSTSTSAPASTSTTQTHVATSTPTTIYVTPTTASPPTTTAPPPSTTTTTAPPPTTTTTTTTAPAEDTVTIIPGSCKSASGAGTFTQGQEDTLKAVVPSGYYFWGGWTGSGSGSYTGPNNPVTITVEGNITETANCYYSPPPPTTTTTTSPPPLPPPGFG